FSTCVEHRMDNFHSRYTHFGMDPHRYPTSIILYSNGIIFFNDNLDPVTSPSKGLIHTVGNYLIYQVMQTSERCSTYIHPRSFPDSLEPLQYEYLIFIIIDIVVLNVYLAHLILL